MRRLLITQDEHLSLSLDMSSQAVRLNRIKACKINSPIKWLRTKKSEENVQIQRIEEKS